MSPGLPQRLCKYPLLLRDLVAKLPDGPQREAISHALDDIRTVAEQVNERVRDAEGRARLLALAEMLDRQDLVVPARSLLSEVDLEAQQLGGSARGSMGNRGEHRLWLCSDVVLLGKRARGHHSHSHSHSAHTRNTPPKASAPCFGLVAMVRDPPPRTYD
uniref:DH domain-containing protein n=1 Tax=Chrysotila carterae TaxID=13221 RepID=A0A7S4BQR8_CHRCT